MTEVTLKHLHVVMDFAQFAHGGYRHAECGSGYSQMSQTYILLNRMIMRTHGMLQHLTPFFMQFFCLFHNFRFQIKVKTVA